MSDPSVERASEKRRRIIEAAKFLVLRNGLRATTMEAIAREAHIAKPTLYAQFPDKDAVFAGIVDTVMDELMAAYDAGMRGPGVLADRVGNALAGQYTSLGKTMADSPHASELMSEHRRGGARFREKDLRAEAEIAAGLREIGTADPDALAKVICSAAYGIALKTSDETAMAAGIKLLCRRMIGGALD